MELSCCLIGEDSLLIQCGNILLAKGCWIERVVSPVTNIQEWAQKNDIVWVSTLEELLASHFNKVDYIFSIVNSRILPSAVLHLAHHGAINYHDSLLPKYAGVNATTWAIINNEIEHGVTWHVVNEKIDEGNIVKQVQFPISNEDTAFTLNLRCYEYAIQSFREMLAEIENGTLTYVKQSLQNRSYFGVAKILPNFGFIDWDNFSAEFIAQLSKATELGHYNNNIGFLKLYLNDDYIIVSHASIADVNSEKFTPGTIIAIKDGAIYIATVTKAVKIDRFISKEGIADNIDTLIKAYGLIEGLRFLNIQDEQAYFKILYPSVLKSEKYWINQINSLTEHATFSPASINKDKKWNKSYTKIAITPLLSETHQNKKKNIILAAILIYLYRLNNYESVAVSLVYKKHHELMNPLGKLFSSFLPLVTDGNSDANFEAILADVEKHVEMQAEHHTFFSDIAARHPILENKKLVSEIIINLTDNYENIVIPDNALLYFQYDTLHEELLISHCIDDHYHSGFLKEILCNLTSHITTIIDFIVTKPHVKISEFCFLTSLEKITLLNHWGMGKPVALPEQSLSVLFEKQVTSHPNNPAIVMADQVITYQELWLMAEKVVLTIKEMELPPQSLIGMYVNRSIEMLAIILGILKADCVYVPLDTKYPLLKIETIANEAQLSHLITTEDLTEKLAGQFEGNQEINLYAIESILANTNVAKKTQGERINDPTKHALAYVMFTSGTTGTPKGVAITQKNVLNYCTWFTETTNFTASSIIDFSSSIAFDLSVPCTIAPLLTGGCIAICNEADKTNPERYLTHLQHHKVTHTELTPGYIEMLLHYPDAIRQLMDLKFLMLGADVVHTEEVIKWLKLCPHHQVVNEYGPTETTVSVTSYFMDTDAFLSEAAVPIGRPAFNSTAYLLDKHKNLCPIGMKGELYVGGFQVANGYLGKPDLTLERFVPLILNTSMEIMYKTGDLAGWLPDGNLQFFGRNDFQVKIQGYRIELPAIESALLKMPAIDQAVVIVQKGQFKEKYLRAYIVSDTKKLSVGEIKAHLSVSLASYMIPKEFCITSGIPLKDNEKIDFEALEKQSYNLLAFEHEVNDALTESEQITMRIWNHAFNTTTINHHDDFFALGGDSLLALQIISDLKHHYQLDIPLFYLFEYPTVAKLAAKIETLLQPLNSPGSSLEVIDKPKCIIKLSSGAHKIPLFLIHPVGGSVFWYKQLAKCLAGQYTIYGIQDPSIDGHDLRFSSLEEMAAYYIKEISSVYSGDSFSIGGASFGATVAFEIANQLIKANKTLNFIGLFDGWASYPEKLMKENTIHLLTYSEEKEDLLNYDKKEYLIRMEEYRKSLLLNYQIPNIQANAVLYKAAELWEDFAKIDDPYNGWLPFVRGQCKAHLIDGNHETLLFSPNVISLARKIASDLY